MTTAHERSDDMRPRLGSAWNIFHTEWKIWIPGGVLCVVVASVLITGHVLPDLGYPYTYAKDGLSHSWFIQRLIEGWISDNPRSGYPFGSNFLDYPNSDFANLALLKLLGALTERYYSALDIYFLLGFLPTFAASYCVLRAMNARIAVSACAAVLYDFLPFHLERLNHLFFTWYFVAPIFFYMGLTIFVGKSADSRVPTSWTRHLGLLLGLLTLASFGVYYALFGAIILGFSGLAGSIRFRCIEPLKKAFSAILIVIVGVAANCTPTLLYTHAAGPDTEVAVRSSVEGEIYGLKLLQLVLPQDHHRIKTLARIKDTYNTSSPLVNENSSASLGVVGTIGLVIAGVLLVASLAGRALAPHFSLLALLTFVLFMFGTVGGLGALFSLFAPSIRGWNRISVFIGFGTITLFFLTIQQLTIWNASPTRRRIVLVIALPVILAAGMFDQTTGYYHSLSLESKVEFDCDRSFVRNIEASVPAGSAIYQLPYMPFPETPPLFRLHTYSHVSGFLNSRTLRWNYAGMKGRPGDLFYRALAQEPIEKQIDVIKRLGFAGVYVDQRGYKDDGKQIISELKALLGPPTVSRNDNEAVFFPVPDTHAENLDGLTASQIMQRAGFVADSLGRRYPATLEDGIDFKRAGWPNFVQDVSGLSGKEAWGRWSDADEGPQVQITFFTPLPQRFVLDLIVSPFGPNVNRDLTVRIGTLTYKVSIPSADFHTRIPVDLKGQHVNSVEFEPQTPISPRQLGTGTDDRKLGIGFIHLSIDEK